MGEDQVDSDMEGAGGCCAPQGFHLSSVLSLIGGALLPYLLVPASHSLGTPQQPVPQIED